MIGILDSGVGGLSIYQEVKSRFPGTGVVYFADKVNFPYGDKSEQELSVIVKKAINHLIEHGARVVVLACNSATVSTVEAMISEFDIPIVGIEPAIKLAAAGTKTHKIGVLATKRTTESHDGDKLAPQCLLYKHHNEDLVSQIENNYVGINDEELLKAIRPFTEVGCDAVVLGCTHYSFVKDRFEKLFPQINFYSPDKAVINRLEVIVTEKKIEILPSNDIFLCSADRDGFRNSLNNLLGIQYADIRKI